MGKIRCFLGHFTYKILAICCLFVCFSTLFAEETNLEKQVVKVGYFPHKSFVIKNADGKYSGYFYEYLENLSPYLGWTYEFIEAPFDVTCSNLMRSKVDIMCGLPYSSSLVHDCLFTNLQVGNYELDVLARNKDERFIQNDLKNLNGCKVGYVKSMVSGEILKYTFDTYDVDCEIIGYANSTDLHKSLIKEKIDVIVDSRENHKHDFSYVESLNALPFYFAVSPNNQKVLQGLNNAISRIKVVNPDFETYLHGKYIQREGAIHFTSEEKAYVINNPVVKVYYRERPPLEFTNNGKYDGIMKELMKIISQKSGLEFEFEPFNTDIFNADRISDKDKDEIILSVYDSVWAQNNNCVMTAPFLEIPLVRIKSDKDTKNIAIPELTPLNDYIKNKLPELNLKYFSSVKECFDSLVNGEPNACFMNMYMADYYLRQREYRNLEFTNIYNYYDRYTLSVLEPGNMHLYSILEKSLLSIPKDEMADIISGYTKDIDDFTFSDIAYTFPSQVVLLAIVSLFALGFLIILCVLIVKYLLKRRLVKDLRYKADYDVMTGLYKKDRFFIETRKLLDENPNTQYVIMVSDIERFKVINDLYGVKKGDDLLKYISKYIQENYKGNSTYGYLESDHFVYCYPYDKAQFRIWEENTARYLENFDIDFKIVQYYGLYIIDDRNMDVSLMCDRARLALHEVKGNYMTHLAYYDDKLRKRILEEQDIVNRMNQALTNKEFIVYLQPQYNLVTCELIGAEALVRWRLPDGSMISPATFIPIFEKNGFITQLDKYVWQEVCAILQRWHLKGMKMVPISVNISRKDIYNLALPTVFHDLIDSYSIPANYLKLEITESAYVENPEQLMETVSHLQKMHFTVEMDDFGSGYSSLNILKDVPVDVLKLDLRFLSSDTSDQESRGGNILNSIVRMAKWLNLPVIAEGVETMAQADFLRSIGCQFVQGYLYSPPVPVADFEKILNNSELNRNDAEIIKSQVLLDDFWNPTSISSLSFNNFMPAACVFEYQNENLELIRANDKFYEEIGVTSDEFAKYKVDICQLICEEDRPKMCKIIERTISKGETSGVLHWHLGEDKPKVFLHIRSQLIANNNENYVFLVTIGNISEVDRSYRKKN